MFTGIQTSALRFIFFFLFIVIVVVILFFFIGGLSIYQMQQKRVKLKKANQNIQIIIMKLKKKPYKSYLVVVERQLKGLNRLVEMRHKIIQKVNQWLWTTKEMMVVVMFLWRRIRKRMCRKRMVIVIVMLYRLVSFLF